jgi:hypothetical protein
MEFNQYQALAKTTAIYPENIKYLYPILGLAGETGEVIEKVINSLIIGGDISCTNYNKVQKAIQLLNEIKDRAKELEIIKKELRKDASGVIIDNNLYPEEVNEISKELGDQMWYQAATCSDFGLEMGNVAQANYDKLKSRQERGVLQGSGDNR